MIRNAAAEFQDLQNDMLSTLAKDKQYKRTTWRGMPGL